MDKLKYKFHSFEIFTDQGILIKGNKQRLREIFSKNNSIVSVAGKKVRTCEFNLNNFGVA